MKHTTKLELVPAVRWAAKESVDWLGPRLARLGWGFVAGFLTGLIFVTLHHMHLAGGLR